MSKVLLINPSYMGSYGGNKMSVVMPILPVLSLATVAAGVREKGHKVQILDLAYTKYDPQYIADQIKAYGPDLVGVTALTPHANQLRDMSILIKDISTNIAVVAGGPHVSSLPREILLESMLDAVITGEGDFALAEILERGDFRGIDGLYWRDGDVVISENPRLPIRDINDLPIPAWDLYDPEIYARVTSKLLCRRPPWATIEFSRGCVFKCDYCASKMTMALGYRKKTPERCAEEVDTLIRLGFREFMVADDIFTSDEKWATQVCEEIIRRKLDISWTCTNGIRVESADEKLFNTMYAAGCYRVSFGFESGNDEVLKRFGKGGKATIAQAGIAVDMAKKAKIETNGFFMIGLSADTKETIEETIEFSRSLPLDILKFSSTIAFPGTEMFNNYMKKGLVKSFDWDDYHIYSSVDLFNHENLSSQEINEYMDAAYRRAIIHNPRFIWRRLLRGLQTGEFFWDLYYFIKFVFTATTNESQIEYYARDRWPEYDFHGNGTTPSFYQKVGSNRIQKVES